MAAAPAAAASAPPVKQQVSLLAELLGKQVCVVTLEGRCLVGTLRGVDGVNNLVLENTHERTFHADRGMEMEPMGLYLVRGDSLCVGGAALAAFLQCPLSVTAALCYVFAVCV